MLVEQIIALIARPIRKQPAVAGPAKLEALSPAETPPTRGRKFYIALAAYAVIALLAGVTLDGKLRLAVWVFLGYLAFRTYFHTIQKL